MNTNGMKQIGKGAFSTVYQNTKNKVLIKSTDSVKECMSNDWFPDTSLFPSITQVGSSDCEKFKFYEEKFYPKVRKIKDNLSAFEFEFYQVLRMLFKNKFVSFNPYDLFSDWHKIFDKIPNKFHHKRKMLKEALDALSNYGSDICFEISPRNIAIQGKKLILLDCFFLQSELVRNRS